MKRNIVALFKIIACLPMYALLVLGLPFLLAYIVADELGRKWRVV
jgi:hypothetical protein